MTHRYTIHPIADEHMTTYHDAVAEIDDPSADSAIITLEANRAYYGVAIVDHVTGLIDWGFGFGLDRN